MIIEGTVGDRLACCGRCTSGGLAVSPARSCRLSERLAVAAHMARLIDDIGRPWVCISKSATRCDKALRSIEWKFLGNVAARSTSKNKTSTRRWQRACARALTPRSARRHQLACRAAEPTRIRFTDWATAEIKAGDWACPACVSRRMDQLLDL